MNPVTLSSLSLAESETLLADYRAMIENALRSAVEVFGPKTPLRDACAYALLGGGKRWRPIIVHMVAKSLGYEANVSYPALAVEFFHTASLAADDLPCMDDDDERRDRASLHKVYGEAMALLASYGLIAEGYRCYARGAEQLRQSSLFFASQSDRICTTVIDSASANCGLQGATGGQFLNLAPPDDSLETLKAILHQKTTTLFEIAFVSGWLYGGGAFEDLPDVKKAAAHFGLAFQVIDDLGDMDKDAQIGRRCNLANHLGAEAASQLVDDELKSFESVVCGLGVEPHELLLLSQNLKEKKARVAGRCPA